MLGWLARLRRVDALETELAALRARLADADARTALETERARAAEASARLGEKLAALHVLATESSDRVATATRTLELLGTRVTALAARVETLERPKSAPGEEDPIEAALATQRAQLLTLERQFRLQTNQTEETVRALFDRIEQVRRGEEP